MRFLDADFAVTSSEGTEKLKILFVLPLEYSVFRRDRVSDREGEISTSKSSKSLAGPFDYNWDT